MTKTKGAKQVAKAVERTDVAVTHQVAEHRNSPAMRVLGFLAEGADQPPLAIASVGTIGIGLIARRPDLVRGGTRMLVAHLLTIVAKNAIKHSFDRTRPEAALEEGEHRFEPGDSHDHDLNSFPSGHTAGAVAVSRALARDVPAVARPAALAASAVAVAQPPIGHHYVTDVVAGAAVGWIVEEVTSALFDRIEPVVIDAVRRGLASTPTSR